MRRLVERGHRHLNGEARQRPPRDFGGGGQHVCRIDAAAQIADHRHVGAEPDLDGALERRLELVDQRRWIGCVLLIAPIGKVEIPIAPLLDCGGAAVLPERDPEIVARQDRLHAVEQRAARAERIEGEEMIEPLHIDRSRHGA